MRRLMLLGMALTAVLAASAMLSMAAFAADETPLNLPFTKGETWTGASEGELTFHSSTSDITCKSATAEGNTESNLPPLGLFHIHFKGCSSSGQTCTGLGEEAGVFLMLGTWHLVYDEKGATFELHVATLYLVEPTHFNCTALVLVELKGEQLCLDLEPEVSSRKHSFHCAGSGTKQEDNWCMKDIAEKCSELLVPLLLASTNHAAFKEAALLALGFWETSTNAVAAMKL